MTEGGVPSLRSSHMPGRPMLNWATWLIALGIATIGMRHFRLQLDKAHVALVFLLVVLGASAAGGRILGLTIAFLSFLSFDFLFLPPYATLALANPLDWLVLLAFLLTSVVATQLLYRANATALAATERAKEVDRLAAVGAETLNAVDAADALRAIAAVIRNSVDADECDIYLKRTGGEVDLVARTLRSPAVGADGPRAARQVAPPETPPRSDGLVGWILQHGMGAAELEDGTIRLSQQPPVGGSVPAVRAFALPLRVRERIVGVLRIATTGELRLTAEQSRLLTALSYYAALGADRAHLVATAERAEAERRVEALRSALLTAVSHDLRTPLTTIKGIAHEIASGGDRARAEVIGKEADRLDDLVGALLDLSRIHAGAVRADPHVNTVDDLLGAALRGAAGALHGRVVNVEVPPDMLLAGFFDFSLTLRILINLLDNAAKYSPPATSVDMRVRQSGDQLVFEVLDRGPGIPDSEQARIFEPFYRPPGVSPDVRGHGLGLSIARGLAEAQGGTLSFVPREGGGSVFSLKLPAAIATPPDDATGSLGAP